MSTFWAIVAVIAAFGGIGLLGVTILALGSMRQANKERNSSD